MARWQLGGFSEHLQPLGNGFTVDRGGVDQWHCAGSQIPALVAALRDLGHITDEPEPLSWYTVERHGQPGLWQRIVAVAAEGCLPVVTGRAPAVEFPSDYRYLPLDHLRGHTELPGWDDVAPAPEPELPAPWLPVTDEGEDEYDFLACFAFALDGGVVVVERRRPQPSDDHVIAWCPVGDGEVVPPHPYARAEQ